MAQGLFIGFTSDTLWALAQVLSLVCAVAPMGISLWTPPEVSLCVEFLRKRERHCLFRGGGEIGDYSEWKETGI